MLIRVEGREGERFMINEERVAIEGKEGVRRATAGYRVTSRQVVRECFWL